MKTATFDYTDMAEVDSSFIDSVYYNSKSSELAVKMNTGGTHFYGPVPYRVFSDIVDSNSAGGSYNRNVRDKYTNLGRGSVENVTFVSNEDGVVKTFDVTGVSLVTGTYRATSASEAAKMFAEDAGMYYDDVSVTEVREIG